jgi:oligoribonuclease
MVQASRVQGNPLSFEISGIHWDAFRDRHFEHVPFTDGKPEIVWVDIETTGLDTAKDVILEAGIVLTDSVGRICRDGIADWLVYDTTLAHKDWNKAVINMLPFVAEMHGKGQLTHDLMELSRKPMQIMSHASPASVSVSMRRWLHEKTGFKSGEAPMSGSSVHFDRGFIKADLPRLDEWFSYRAGIDVSALRETARKINPKVILTQPVEIKQHRPIPDLINSIQLYRHMLRTFLRTDLEID